MVTKALKWARFVCAGELIHDTVAHVECVTSLAFDSNGLYLLSGAHDGSLRLWNMEKRICLQVNDSLVFENVSNDLYVLICILHQLHTGNPSAPLQILRSCTRRRFSSIAEAHRLRRRGRIR